MFLLASCAEEGNDSPVVVPPSPTPECNHSWSEWSVTQDATCLDTGNRERTCLLCGTVQTSSLPAKGHSYQTVTVPATCTEEGSVSKVCSRCGDTVLENVIESEGHEYNALLECVKCGEAYSSEGLVFAPYGDGYALTSASSVTDEFLIIPEKFEGKSVVSVSENAFTDTHFNGIYFPATVIEIKADIALIDADKLCFASSGFPDGVTGENFAGEIVFNAKSARLNLHHVLCGAFPEELYFEITDAEGNFSSVKVSEDIIEGEVDPLVAGEKTFGIIYDGYVYEVSITFYEKGTAEIISIFTDKGYYRTVKEGLPEMTVCFTDIYGYTDEVGLDLLEIAEEADFTTAGIKTFTVKYYGKDYLVTAELYDPDVTNVRSVTFDNTVFRVRQGTNLEGYFALTFTGQTVLVNYYEGVDGETAEQIVLKQGDYSLDYDFDSSATGTYTFYFIYRGYRTELMLEVVPDGEAQYVFTSGDPTLRWTAYLYEDGTAELSGLGYGRYEFVDGLLNVKIFIEGWELSFLFVYDTDENTYNWYDFGKDNLIATYIFRDVYVLVYENGLKLCSAENGDGIQFSAEYTLENNKLYSAGYLFEIDKDGNLTVINTIF